MTKPTKLSMPAGEVLAKIGELAYHIGRLSPNEMKSLMRELERIRHALVISGEDADISGVNVSLNEIDLHDGIRSYLATFDIDFLNYDEIYERFG